MYTVELAWFCFDLPDHADIEAITSTPNPLFPDTRVTTRWRVSLERFVMDVSLSASRDLSDLSRAAFDLGEPELAATPISINGLPGVRAGAYDRDRTQKDWWVTSNGLTLAITLTASGYPRTIPTQAEVEEHDAIVASLRRITDLD